MTKFRRSWLLVSVIVLNVLVTLVFGAKEFPVSIERCRYGDTKCLAKTITAIFAHHPDGIPEIGLGSLDPFYIPISKIVGGGLADDPVRLNITMKNIKLTGWKKLEVKNVIGFEKDPKQSPFVIDTYVPVESLVGKYNLNGQLLVLPISGKGLANITFKNIDMKVTLQTSVRTDSVDNEDYLIVRSVSVAVNAKHMLINFTNLFNDQAISDNMNAIINENADALIQEFRPSIARSFQMILNEFIPPVFEKFPYRMWFLDGVEDPNVAE